MIKINEQITFRQNAWFAESLSSQYRQICLINFLQTFSSVKVDKVINWNYFYLYLLTYRNYVNLNFRSGLTNNTRF